MRSKVFQRKIYKAEHPKRAAPGRRAMNSPGTSAYEQNTPLCQFWFFGVRLGALLSDPTRRQ